MSLKVWPPSTDSKTWAVPAPGPSANWAGAWKPPAGACEARGVAELSISRVVTELARRDPGRLAVRDSTTALTRSELDLRTNGLARAYARLGVRAGDMVTVALPNSAGFVESCVAAWKLGATPQPLSARLPAAERDAVLALAQPALVVGVPDGSVPGRRTLPDAGKPDADTGELPEAVSPEWKAPTSGGSTGRPKLIVATTAGRFDPDVPAVPYLHRDGVQLVAGPLYHNGPFLYAFRGLFCGHALVVRERFDAEDWLRSVQEHEVTWTMAVPTMLHRIWRLPAEVRTAYDVGSLRVLLHLGAPCPPELKRAWIGWLGPGRVWELYAGTEGNGVTVLDGHEWLAHPGSVGRPALGSRVRVLDEDGRDLSAGQVGEVFLLPAGGTGSTYRYVGAEPRRREGWDSLGDLGWLDEDGYLYLVDRRTDCILSGGANVYPAEVEAALDSHPAVRSSAVVGLPDDDLGERVHALVDATAPVEPAELLAHVGGRLARYKVPRSVELVDGPLRDDAGKLRRSQLRADRLPTDRVSADRVSAEGPAPSRSPSAGPA